MERHRWKRILAALALAVGIAASAAGCAAQSQPVEDQGLPVLRVGFEAMNVPACWSQNTAENGAVPLVGTSQYAAGFEVEYMRRVCELAGYRMEAYKFDWDGLMMAVPSGKVDCAIDMIAPTAERQKTMDFTDPYYYADTAVLVRADSTYAKAASLEELAGARTTSMLNTLWYGQVDQIPGVDKAPAMENVPAMLVALKAGTVDAVLVDAPSAEGAVAANPELAVVPLAEGQGFDTAPEDIAASIAVQKGDTALVQRLNAAIAQISVEELEQMIEEACENQPEATPQSFFAWVRLLLRQYGPAFLRGTAVAVWLAVAGTFLGSVIGCIAGVLTTLPLDEESGFAKKVVLRLVRGIVALYVWLFRGTPMMVQAMVIFYGAAQLFGWDMDPMWAGLFILSVNTGAYMAETVRGGIQSVDPGQEEGAESIGMTHFQTMRLVILPQAFRSILPQIGNYLISNIKDTSMLSVITVGELFYISRTAAGNYFRYFEVFFITCAIYLALTTVATALLRWAEKRLAGPKVYALAGTEGL